MAALDVSTLTCPMTWIKAKVALDELDAGERLDVRCAPGSEALANIPLSARQEGHVATVDGDTVAIVKR